MSKGELAMKKLLTAAAVIALTASVASANNGFEYDFHGMVEFITGHGPVRSNIDNDWTPTPVFTAEVPMPIVEFMNEEELDTLWPGAGVVAMYDSELFTMFLNEDIDPNSPEGYSVILHELVHHVQNMNGLSNTSCPGNLEHDAYRIQITYLKQNIETVDPEFLKMIEMGQLLGPGGICYEDKKF